MAHSIGAILYRQHKRCANFRKSSTKLYWVIEFCVHTRDTEEATKYTPKKEEKNIDVIL